MSTILFIILKLNGLIDTRIDWVLLCAFVAADLIAAGLQQIMWAIRKKN